MAGAIAELAKWALAADFRNIDPRSARVILIEGGPRLLPALHADLSDKARQSLEKLGVEVRLSAMVTGCTDKDVAIGDERIATRTIMWAAGVRASPAAAWLGVPSDRAGRVKVASDLAVAEHPDVFVIGDTALALDAGGKPLPGVAPVAKQQGEYLARALVARARGRTPGPFCYRDFGSLATIGRKHAVADFGKVRLSGFIAWVLWSVAHVYFLIGFRRRMIVALHWAWSYLTFQRGTRLITGLTGSRMRANGEDEKQSRDTLRGAA
jgi:NADH dehydrogenase